MDHCFSLRAGCPARGCLARGGSPPVGAYLREVAGGRRRDEGRADRQLFGGQTYTGKVRKKENLHTARIGDSVVVRYLPDDPGVHRLVTDSAGRYKVDRCARGRSRSRC